MYARLSGLSGQFVPHASGGAYLVKPVNIILWCRPAELHRRGYCFQLLSVCISRPANEVYRAIKKEGNAKLMRSLLRIYPEVFYQGAIQKFAGVELVYFSTLLFYIG